MNKKRKGRVKNNLLINIGLAPKINEHCQLLTINIGGMNF
jgi:hypothetical protein